MLPWDLHFTQNVPQSKIPQKDGSAPKEQDELDKSAEIKVDEQRPKVEQW